MKFLDKLKEYGIPTNSYLDAITYIQESPELSPEDFRIRLIEMTGKGDDIDCGVLSKYTYMYVIQETLRVINASKSDVNMAEMFKEGHSKAIAFLDARPHLLETTEESEENKKSTKPRTKKDLTCELWNKHQDEGLARRDWIALIMKEVGISKGGASTYYARLKKGTFGC